jgi:hypothetical protein
MAHHFPYNIFLKKLTLTNNWDIYHFFVPTITIYRKKERTDRFHAITEIENKMNECIYNTMMNAISTDLLIMRLYFLYISCSSINRFSLTTLVQKYFMRSSLSELILKVTLYKLLMHKVIKLYI